MRPDEAVPWVEHKSKELALREALLALIKGFFGSAANDDTAGPCTEERKTACRARYGRYFEETCRMCPNNADRITDGAK